MTQTTPDKSSPTASARPTPPTDRDPAGARGSNPGAGDTASATDARTRGADDPRGESGMGADDGHIVGMTPAVRAALAVARAGAGHATDGADPVCDTATEGKRDPAVRAAASVTPRSLPSASTPHDQRTTPASTSPRNESAKTTPASAAADPGSAAVRALTTPKSSKARNSTPTNTATATRTNTDPPTRPKARVSRRRGVAKATPNATGTAAERTQPAQTRERGAASKPKVREANRSRVPAAAPVRKERTQSTADASPPATTAGPPPTASSVTPSTQARAGTPVHRGRLRPGQLRELVAGALAERPDSELTPTQLSNVLRRSAGAIANALVTLCEQGAVIQTNTKPRTYRTATRTAGGRTRARRRSASPRPEHG
jgi:hypothetical protein